jgi:SAM-dependent methyltransferase
VYNERVGDGADDGAARARVAATRAFFGPRATAWDATFPDDGPGYARAIAQLAPSTGATVLDAGCGTGRALPHLRAAIGTHGLLVAVDVTEQMLAHAAHSARTAHAHVVLADVVRLPLRDQSCDVVFAAGLLSHLPDPVAGLVELARVCRPGGRLALFHPIGRADLARRHGHALEPADVRSEHRIEPALAAAGWRCELVDDAPDRYLTIAVRQ